MSKQEKKTEANTREAIYVGRRLLQNGATAHCFLLLPEKREMLFRGIKGIFIGYTYKCGSSTMPVRPDRTEAERIDNPEWEAADALVDARNARKRAEAKIRKSTRPALRNAIAALRPLLRGMSYFDRKELITYLAEQTKRKGDEV